MLLKSIIRKIIPQWLIAIYHWQLAWLGAIRYGFPSSKLIVIGVTGTNGKSTTVNFLAKVLQQTGQKVGFVTTANVSDGKNEWLNKWKLTMPGRLTLQKLLWQMVNNGCQYAIVETSSEGLIQYRHVSINYDVAVFTNLTPEHLERHGGFDNYKKAKGILFKHLTRRPHKKISGQTRLPRPNAVGPLRRSSSEASYGGQVIPKTIVVNGDDEHGEYFLSFMADRKAIFGFKNREVGIDSRQSNHIIINGENLYVDIWGSSFLINNQKFEVKLAGQFNAYNALASVAVGQILGLSLTQCAKGIASLLAVPGRMEKIDAGQPFTVIVDYAPEPISMQQLYQAVVNIPHRMIIHVLGSAGGGRDKARRPILGRLAAEHAGVVIVTNEDPYDEDPQMIIDQVAAGAEAVGKAEVIKMSDRRQAIHEALELARTGDLVLITGKSCEQWICLAGGRKQAWDDRVVVREELQKLGYG